MTPLGDLRHHYWLVQRMAQRTGVDLVGAYEEGRIDPEDWAGMVQACRGCEWAEGCAEWLGRKSEAAAAPKPCCNRARLAMLRLEEELAV